MHESWEDNISEEEQWAKVNIDKNRQSYIKKDCFEKSHNYCSTGERTAELSMHILKILFPQKLSDVSFANPTTTVGLKLLKFSLLKVILKWRHDHKRGTSDNWKLTRDMVR
jgi:hypothetical protein